MKKLLLAALAIGPLGGVAVLRPDAQGPTTVLVPGTEGLSFGFPSGYNSSPRYLIIIPTGTLDTRMFTIMRMPKIGTHIIPLHQPTGTADIGLTTSSIGMIIPPAASPNQRC
jgi:hypothetical protein